MKHPLRSSMVGLALAGAVAAACSSSSSDDKKTGGAGATGMQSVSTCSSPTLQVLFSPMYSAYDGKHDFKVPAVVAGANAADVTWTSSDSTKVNIAKTAQGATITTKAAGAVDIIATVGSACGVSKLTITAATPEQWEIGNQRYHNGFEFGPVPDGGVGGPPDGGAGGPPGDGGAGGPPAEFANAKCTNCHGDTATGGPITTIQHSPQQTGGLSDQEMIDLFTKAVWPPQLPYDISGLDKQAWLFIHKWQMTAEEAKGILVYLRSLPPVAQTGKADEDFFGQFRPRDAGTP